MAGGFGFAQGARLGGEEGFSVRVQVNEGDLVRLNNKITGASQAITPALWARGKRLIAIAVRELNRTAPRGAGGDWIRGSPPLESSHGGVMINAYQGVVYSSARHARFIVQGFTPHMPPERAWLGDPKLSYVMRRAVLINETPEAPRDYFSPVADKLEIFNQTEAEIMEHTIKAAMDAG